MDHFFTNYLYYIENIHKRISIENEDDNENDGIDASFLQGLPKLFQRTDPPQPTATSTSSSTSTTKKKTKTTSTKSKKKKKKKKDKP